MIIDSSWKGDQFPTSTIKRILRFAGWLSGVADRMNMYLKQQLLNMLNRKVLMCNLLLPIASDDQPAKHCECVLECIIRPQ